MKLLMIQAHPATASHSNSLDVAERFRQAYQANHPDDEVIIRDVSAGSPGISSDLFGAMQHLRAGMAREALPASEQKLMQQRHLLIEEFVTADKYVFVNPNYNYFLPTEMKQYIDTIAAVRQLFYYTPAGPVGLLHDKKALHIQASGDIYHTGPNPQHTKDFGDEYLQYILQIFGVTDYHGLFIEGGRLNPEKTTDILAAARQQAETLAATF